MKLERIPRSSDGCDFCAVCGKRYIKQACSIYKVTFQGKVYSECSYTCWQKARNMKEGKDS